MKISVAVLPPALIVSAIVCWAGQTPNEVNLSRSDTQRSLSKGVSESVPRNYVLGPDDQIVVVASNIEELSPNNLKVPLRVDLEGDVDLPLIGRVHAAGLTVNQFQAMVRTRLEKFVRDPDVVVVITDFHSQPVSVLGAVSNPGVHQLEGHKRLFEVLSAAGGLRQDAGSTIKITRDLEWGRVPLPNAHDDSTGRFSVASLDVKPIMAASDPAQNIEIKPQDVISVPAAELVYVVGRVKKPGGFPLGENRSLSALQVLSLAEGLDKYAIPQKAKIIRVTAGTSDRTEIPVDLKRLMSGGGSDVPLRPDDILFVPNSMAKAAAVGAADTIVRIAAGLVVYGRY